MYFDSHAHYDDNAFNDDRDALLSSMQAGGVGLILNCGASISSSRTSVALSEKYPFIYAAVGVHPHDAKELSSLDELRLLASYNKVVAIGEIGLDYHYDLSDRQTQKIWFKEQLRLANELHLPVCIHEREAFYDCIEILKSEPPKFGGVMHSFSGHSESLPDVLSLGLSIGFGGMLTFKNNKKTPEVCRIVPEDRILIETDCPYLAPVPYRGQRNSSILLPAIAERIAQIRGTTARHIENVTFENAKRLFRIM